MRDEPPDQRREFKLRPKEFDALNQPARSAPADGAPTDVHGHLRAAQRGTPTRPPHLSGLPKPKNDVQKLMSEHAARFRGVRLDEVDLRPRRRSKRKQDYWIVLIPVNAVLALIAFGPWGNPMTLAFGLGAMIIFTLGLTWVMWFIMDDY